jgi:8-oxo-dGTP pyrophosphatase MutT (NUDIX family)
MERGAVRGYRRPRVESQAPLERPVGDLGDGSTTRPRLVVDVWLAVPTAEGWRALMLRRSPERGGFWQGVSGRVEAFDASLEAAARREIREETGLALGIEILDLGRWIEFRSPRSGLRYRKRSMGARLPAGTGPETLCLCHEHDRARLVPFEEARRMVLFPANRAELETLEARLSITRGPSAPGRGPRDP